MSADVGQDIDQVSADCRSTYRPRVSTDTRSTDALSTHDPEKVFQALEQTFSINRRVHKATYEWLGYCKMKSAQFQLSATNHNPWK